MENPTGPNSETPVKPAPASTGDPTEAASGAAPAAEASDPAIEALRSQFLNGIGWFYWIGGLSIVNIGMGFVGRKFLFGLGITEVVDALAQSGGTTSVPLLGLSLLLSLGFLALGYQGRKGKRGYILAGLVIYALDAGLLVLEQDWLSAAFHAYAGFSIYRGYAALKKIIAGIST